MTLRYLTAAVLLGAFMSRKAIARLDLKPD